MQRICENYNLTLAEVYAAWSFYTDHQAEVDQHLADGEARLEAYFREHPEEFARRDVMWERYQQKNNTFPED